MKRALGACALIVALAVSFMAPASAAQLVLTGGQHPAFFSNARCDDAVAATNPATATTASAVQLSGIDVACADLPISVRIYDSITATTVIGTAITPTSGGAVGVSMAGSYTPTASTVISVTIASWPVPTTWTYTAMSTTIGCVVFNPGGNTPTGKSCSLAFGPNTDTSGTGWKVAMTVSTTQNQPGTWRATVDFADLARFPFVVKYVGSSTGGLVVGALGSGFCAGTSRVVTITGNVSPGSPIVINLLGSNSIAQPNPVYGCP